MFLGLSPMAGWVTPEQYYRFDGKPGTHLRIGFSNQSESDTKAGIAELGKLIQDDHSSFFFEFLIMLFRLMDWKFLF